MDADLLTDGFVAAAFDLHAATLRRRLTTITRDPELAEDLTQEAFVRLLTQVRSGRCPDDVGAWLARVGHNLAMSQGRRKAVAARHRGDLVRTEVMPSPEAVTLAVEEQRSVAAVLEGLAAVDRDALVMAAHGYKGAEIARTIGRSEMATRTIMCRARARIRARLHAAEIDAMSA